MGFQGPRAGNVRAIEAFVDGVPSAADDRVTEYSYNGNDDILTMRAMLPGGTFQTTQYVYGVTVAGGNDINSNRLLAEVRYPDKTSGNPGTANADKVRYKYNALGQPKTMTDQNGSIHTYSYDVIGRLTEDYVGTVGAGVDSLVRRLKVFYDTGGRPSQFDSLTSASSLVTRVTWTYNGLGHQVTQDYQLNNYDAGTVGYNYAQDFGSGNYSRLSYMTYPNGRKLHYGYDLYEKGVSGISQVGTTATATATGHGFMVGERIVVSGASPSEYNGVFTVVSVPDANTFTYTMASAPGSNASGASIKAKRWDVDEMIGRSTFLADDNGSGAPSGTHLEDYSYLGLGTIAERVRPEPGVRLTYVNQYVGDEPTGSGDPYTGLDRFGQIVDQCWRKTTGTPADVDRYKYGYDRNGNRQYKENTLSAANSEIYHAGGASAGYDSLNRLTAFKRGTLNGNKDDVTGTPSVNKSWTLDALGNWDSVTGEAQNRVHNKRNQLTSRAGGTITYDSNGNLTTDENGNTYKYDAWNRLREVRTGSSVLVRQFFYDALGRRMVEVDQAGLAKRIYHSLDWQVVEEQEADSCTCGVVRTRTQYVWGMGFVDQLVLRDADADDYAGSGNLGQTGSGLEQRLYVLQDANWNVTSVINVSGVAQERYLYDTYGVVTYKTGTWGTRSATAYSQVYLFQGLRYDPVTGLYHARNRDFSPVYGRPIQADPLGYIDGMSLYQWERSSPVAWTDPFGLAPRGGIGNPWPSPPPRDPPAPPPNPEPRPQPYLPMIPPGVPVPWHDPNNPTPGYPGPMTRPPPYVPRPIVPVVIPPSVPAPLSGPTPVGDPGDPGPNYDPKMGSFTHPKDFKKYGKLCGLTIGGMLAAYAAAKGSVAEKCLGVPAMAVLKELLDDAWHDENDEPE